MVWDLEKFSLIFSSLAFVTYVNFLHPKPSFIAPLYILLLLSLSLVFLYPSKQVLSSFTQFKGNNSCLFISGVKFLRFLIVRCTHLTY